MTAPPWANTSTILAMKQMSRIPTGPVYYDSQNMIQILFQLHGSIWWKVLPYCVVNVMIMLALHFLNRHYDGYLRVTLGQNSTMHTFGGIIVSFLCISRLSSSLQGYNECREYISIMFRETSKYKRNLYERSNMKVCFFRVPISICHSFIYLYVLCIPIRRIDDEGNCLFKICWYTIWQY